MKFEWKQSLIWINVVLVYNGKIVTIPNCIVDTGSSSSMLDIDFVEFDYHKPTLIKRLFGIGAGKQEVLYQTVDKVAIDQFEFEAVEIGFGSIKESLKINGFIGNDILSQFILTINFKQKIITFQ